MQRSPAALAMVRIGTRLLPPGEVRQRYRLEMYADLSYLDRPHQMSYAAGVLSTAWSLRHELTKEEHAMSDNTTTPTIPLLCRLNLRHHWRTETTEDGGRFRRCARCGKDNPRLGDPGMPFG
jgi:hypothetical protein